jgi:nicotinate-nucleotide adenylyltransferase
MRVGVFGGQFDPPHLGHMVVAEEARFRLALDRLLVVPSAAPPHRAAPATPAETRLRLADAAFAVDPRTEVTRVEIDRGGPSYTVDTLEQLAGEEELFLVMGADQYATFPSWERSARIRELATLAVALRPGAPAPGGDAIVLPNPGVEVSSSEVRRRLAVGEPVRHIVPAPVLQLIGAEGLYRRTAMVG